jgi:hypothetical protein
MQLSETSFVCQGLLLLCQKEASSTTRNLLRHNKDLQAGWRGHEMWQDEGWTSTRPLAVYGLCRLESSQGISEGGTGLFLLRYLVWWRVRFQFEDTLLSILSIVDGFLQETKEEFGGHPSTERGVLGRLLPERSFSSCSLRWKLDGRGWVCVPASLKCIVLRISLVLRWDDESCTGQVQNSKSDGVTDCFLTSANVYTYTYTYR